jgi:sialic acid synthase SpsE
VRTSPSISLSTIIVSRMNQIAINGRQIGPGQPADIIAELSANHNQSYEEAERLVRIAKERRADAVKIQTHAADTTTLNCDNEYFRIAEWQSRNQRGRLTTETQRSLRRNGTVLSGRTRIVTTVVESPRRRGSVGENHKSNDSRSEGPWAGQTL